MSMCRVFSCFVGRDCLLSNQSILKEISPGCLLEGLMLKLKFQYLATSSEELTHWERPWCWEGLGAGGEGNDRGWDGWMAPPTLWTWVWVDSRSWWWTGRAGVLWFMESQRVRHNWATKLNWTERLFTPGKMLKCVYFSMGLWDEIFSKGSREDQGLGKTWTLVVVKKPEGDYKCELAEPNLQFYSKKSTELSLCPGLSLSLLFYYLLCV